jgi:hypothetical protein
MRKQKHPSGIVNAHPVYTKLESQPTCANALELCSRSEKGRQALKGTALLMFKKKSWQPWIEKFACSDVSKTCGNGVGRTGGTLGIVGTACDAGVVVVLVLTATGKGDDVGGAVGKATFELDVPPTAWGAGCRLCGRQSVNEGR